MIENVLNNSNRPYLLTDPTRYDAFVASMETRSTDGLYSNAMEELARAELLINHPDAHKRNPDAAYAVLSKVFLENDTRWSAEVVRKRVHYAGNPSKTNKLYFFVLHTAALLRLREDEQKASTLETLAAEQMPLLALYVKTDVRRFMEEYAECTPERPRLNTASDRVVQEQPSERISLRFPEFV
jgi:hypothetical protein